MNKLKPLADLPEAQQKALFAILRFRKPGFKTSEVRDKIGGAADGQSVGAVLGALYRNGYLEKVAGGRDKRWILSKQAESAREVMKKHISEVKVYWS